MLKNSLYLFLVLLLSSCKVTKNIYRQPDRETTFTVNTYMDSSYATTVTGRVIDLGDSGPFPDGSIIFKQDGLEKYNQFIDSAGMFKVNNIISGKYKIQVFGADYKTVEMPIEIRKYHKFEITINIKPYLIKLIHKN